MADHSCPQASTSMPGATDDSQRANPAFEAVLATRTVSNGASGGASRVGGIPHQCKGCVGHIWAEGVSITEVVDRAFRGYFEGKAR